jgi:hypothetical protein
MTSHAPEQLALLTGELPDGTCLRIAAHLDTRRNRLRGVITQTRHVPHPDTPDGYREDASCQMQYSGRRLALIPDHLRQLEAELAESGATVNRRAFDPDHLADYLREIG